MVWCEWCVDAPPYSVDIIRHGERGHGDIHVGGRLHLSREIVQQIFTVDEGHLRKLGGQRLLHVRRVRSLEAGKGTKRKPTTEARREAKVREGGVSYNMTSMKWGRGWG